MRRIIDDDKILVAWCNVCNNYTLYNANTLNIDKDNNVCYIYCEHCMNNINIGEMHNEKIYYSTGNSCGATESTL